MQGGGGSPEQAILKGAVATPPCHPELDSGSIQCYWIKLNREIHQTIPRRINKLFPYLLLKRLVGQILKQVQDDRKGITRVGFTMAEILLSLTIIGVVAAITLPSLTGNINERTWNTQRKALYARMSQAIALMPALNGYGTLTEDSSAGASDAEDTATETFITSGLSKVLKINNICDSDHLADCGIPAKILPLGGTSAVELADITTLGGFNNYFVNFSVTTATDTFSYSQIDTKAAAFETANGESILVYYNPYCKADTTDSPNFTAVMPYMCANFVYDLNGTKGPNTVGKDIGFLTAFYPSDSNIVAPLPAIRSAGSTADSHQIGKLCSALDSESRAPNIDELTSIFYNKKLVNITPSSPWATNLKVFNGTLKAASMSFWSGRRGYYTVPNSTAYDVWCVKR